MMHENRKERDRWAWYYKGKAMHPADADGTLGGEDANTGGAPCGCCQWKNTHKPNPLQDMLNAAGWEAWQ